VAAAKEFRRVAKITHSSVQRLCHCMPVNLRVYLLRLVITAARFNAGYTRSGSTWGTISLASDRFRPA